MEQRDPQIAIEKKLYDFIVREARENKRTIKGQVEYMIEKVKTAQEEKKE